MAKSKFGIFGMVDTFVAACCVYLEGAVHEPCSKSLARKKKPMAQLRQSRFTDSHLEVDSSLMNREFLNGALWKNRPIMSASSYLQVAFGDARLLHAKLQVFNFPAAGGQNSPEDFREQKRLKRRLRIGRLTFSPPPAG